MQLTWRIWLKTERTNIMWKNADPHDFLFGRFSAAFLAVVSPILIGCWTTKSGFLQALLTFRQMRLAFLVATKKKLGLWWRPVGGWVESTSSGDGQFFRPRRCLPLWIDRFRIGDMIGAGGVTRWGGVRFGEVEGGVLEPKNRVKVFFSLGT